MTMDHNGVPHDRSGRFAAQQHDEGDINLDLDTGDWPGSAQVEVRWISGSTAWKGATSATVYATVPPDIAELYFSVPSTVTAHVAEAERAIATMSTQLSTVEPGVAEAAVLSLLRAESLSSSRIEGLALSNRRLAEAVYDPPSAKRLDREVANNLRAAHHAIELGVKAAPFTEDDVLELHRILMEGVPGVQAGALRDRQNWIGPSESPTDAVYIPPPADRVPHGITDLVAFVNRTDVSPIIQAAIAHAQFEAIHPFIDGNGRVGRCLISVILRKRTGITTAPPVSGTLLKHTADYFGALRDFQQHADPWRWVTQFAQATTTSCHTASRLTGDIQRLQTSWRERAGRPRQGSITARLIAALPTLSFTDADQVATKLGVDPNVARRGLNALTAAGILSNVAESKRSRVWRADEFHKLLDEYGAGFDRDIEATISRAGDG